MMRRCLAVLALFALAFSFGQLRAAPLDAATCGMLKGEQAQLEQAGVRDTMAKGAEWAKANVAPDKLEQIKRLLQLDEQLLFRCSAKSLVELPTETDAEGAKAPGTDDKPDRAAKDKTSAKKAAPAKKATPPPATEPAAKRTPARPKPKPKPKPKVDDAYRPPPPDPNINPFATQVKPYNSQVK